MDADGLGARVLWSKSQRWKWDGRWGFYYYHGGSWMQLNWSPRGIY